MINYAKPVRDELTDETVKNASYTKEAKLNTNGSTRYPSQIIWDRHLFGFGCRIYPTGRKTFVYRYKNAEGIQRTAFLGTYGEPGRYGFLSFDEARDIAESWHDRAQQSTDPLAERRIESRSILFSQVCREYCESTARPRDQQIVRLHLMQALGHKAVDQVRTDDIFAVHNKIGRLDSKPFTANEVLRETSKIFEFARARGFLDTSAVNPTVGVDRFPQGRQIEHIKEQHLALVAQAINAEPDLTSRCLIWMHVLTDRSSSELIQLTHDEIERPEFADQGVQRVLSIARTVAVKGNKYIFPEPGSARHTLGINNRWKKIKEVAIAWGAESVRHAPLSSLHNSFAGWSGVEISADVLDEAKRGLWKIYPSNYIPTLGEAFDDMRIHKKLKEGTLSYYERLLGIYVPDWLLVKITEITHDAVLIKHREITDKSGPTAANSALRAVSSTLNYALFRFRDDRGEPVLKENPVTVLSALRSWNRLKPKRKTVKVDELPRWYEALMRCTSANIRDYLLLILFTGMRKSEVSCLEWANIDFGNQTLTALDTKNRKDHTLPMSQFIYELLWRRKRDKKCPWVFPNKTFTGPMNIANNSHKLIGVHAGIDFTPHALRRSFVGTARKCRIDVYTIKHILNHTGSSDTTFGCYSVRDVEDLREPIERVSEFLLERLGVVRFKYESRKTPLIGVQVNSISVIEDAEVCLTRG